MFSFTPLPQKILACGWLNKSVKGQVLHISAVLIQYSGANMKTERGFASFNHFSLPKTQNSSPPSVQEYITKFILRQAKASIFKFAKVTS